MKTVTLSSDADWTQLVCHLSDIPRIVISQLGVKYRSVEALRDVNCVIGNGRLTGIIGPNGAGKSTMLKAMLGLIPVTSGSVLYKDKLLMDWLDRVAYVPQRSQIDWTYPATVWDVVMMGRVRKTGWFRRFSAVSRRIAQDALERVGMSAYGDRPIGQLSGGQQQRVFLARALAQEAEIFCFDEPFAGIDQKTQSVIFDIFHELADDGKTVLVVNHDLGESITHFDDLILLNRELIAAGSRQQVFSQENLYRAYSGQVAFFFWRSSLVAEVTMTEYLSGKPPTADQLNEWIEFFHNNGFLVIQNVLTAEQCEVLRNDLDAALIKEFGKEVAGKSRKIMERMFEHSRQNLSLFDLEPIVTFAEHLIGEANGPGYSMIDGIPNANVIHVIHNNYFKIPPETDGLGRNRWHQDDTPHILSLDGKPLTNVRLNVLAFTVNYYLTDVLSEENGPTQVIPGSHLFGKFCDGNTSGYEDKIYSCLGARGTAVCFNNQVWHRGSRNNSEVTRYITQVTYAKRLVGHKYYPFMNYQMPSHCYENASPKLKELLGFLPNGAYG